MKGAFDDCSSAPVTSTPTQRTQLSASKIIRIVNLVSPISKTLDSSVKNIAEPSGYSHPPFRQSLSLKRQSQTTVKASDCQKIPARNNSISPGVDQSSTVVSSQSSLASLKCGVSLIHPVGSEDPDDDFDPPKKMPLKHKPGHSHKQSESVGLLPPAPCDSAPSKLTHGITEHSRRMWISDLDLDLHDKAAIVNEQFLINPAIH